jgi:hypothetical protein
MSASTNRAIKSAGNTGKYILQYLSASPVINNNLAVTNVFSYQSTQIGTNYVATSIALRAGDDTTIVNRFRIEIYHEASGSTYQDYIFSPTTLPLYADGGLTEIRFVLDEIINVTSDATDGFKVNVYADYEGNTEPLTIGATFILTKLI